MANNIFRLLSRDQLSYGLTDIRRRNKSTLVKTAILMLNMGGPQKSSQVEEYLHRIMTDRDMIQLPMQGTLGPLIAKRRAPEVAKKYDEIGGGSPIFQWTQRQGELMCRKLDLECPESAPHKHYIGFRYADPLTDATLPLIEREGAERLVLFSQYPHYSCATSGSSFNAIYSYYSTRSPPSKMKWSVIDRWSTHPLLVQTFADNIKKELAKFPSSVQKDVIILFSAHSLPLKAVNRGDAYPSEVGATVQLVMNQLNYCNPYSLVWQSKVGPLPWLAPFTDEAMEGYVKQGKKNFLLVPIAFVNEHIETLHEMDIEYCKDLGAKLGIEHIRRVPAPNDHPLFIEALVDIVKNNLSAKSIVNPKFLMRCPHCVNSRCTQAKEWHEVVWDCWWMSERVLLSGDGAPLLTLAHIKKEADGASYIPCGMDFAVPSSPGSPDRQFCSSTTQFGSDSACNADVKEEEGAPRRACLVCGDVASGFHYGVASCEACKAFFKRTIQGNIEYTCPAANDCEINKRRRKACQACRFQKCLRMGMLKEGVRLDRVRGGRQKYRRNTDGPYQLQTLPQLKPYPNLEDNKLLEALAINEPDLSITTPDVSATDPILRALNVLSDIYDQELVKIITWAKHIPGFVELSLNDQMRLLQSTWAEVLTLTIAFRSLPTSGELKFAADLLVDEKMAREGGFIELHQILSTVTSRMERLGVTKEEYYVMKALILANSDVRIEEPQPLKKLRESIISALSDCVTAMRAGGTALHMHHLLLCLPAVRQADHLHRRFWSNVHRDGKVYMNKLFVEMLESYVR